MQQRTRLEREGPPHLAPPGREERGRVVALQHAQGEAQFGQRRRVLGDRRAEQILSGAVNSEQATPVPCVQSWLKRSRLFILPASIRSHGWEAPVTRAAGRGGDVFVDRLPPEADRAIVRKSAPQDGANIGGGVASHMEQLTEGPGTVYRSEDYPAKERVNAWADMTIHSIMPTTIRVEDPGGFTASMRQAEFGSTAFSALTYSPLQCVRTAAHIRRSDPESYMLALTLRGAQSISQMGRDATLGPPPGAVRQFVAAPRRVPPRAARRNRCWCTSPERWCRCRGRRSASCWRCGCPPARGSPPWWHGPSPP